MHVCLSVNVCIDVFMFVCLSVYMFVYYLFVTHLLVISITIKLMLGFCIFLVETENKTIKTPQNNTLVKWPVVYVLYSNGI